MSVFTVTPMEIHQNITTILAGCAHALRKHAARNLTEEGLKDPAQMQAALIFDLCISALHNNWNNTFIFQSPTYYKSTDWIVLTTRFSFPSTRDDRDAAYIAAAELASAANHLLRVKSERHWGSTIDDLLCRTEEALRWIHEHVLSWLYLSLASGTWQSSDHFENRTANLTARTFELHRDKTLKDQFDKAVSIDTGAKEPSFIP